MFNGHIDTVTLTGYTGERFRGMRLIRLFGAICLRPPKPGALSAKGE